MILVVDCETDALSCRLMSRGRQWELAAMEVREIGRGEGYLQQNVPGRRVGGQPVCCPDHRRALALVLQALSGAGFAVPGGLAAVAHRVTHGGECFRRSVRLDAQLRQWLREEDPFAAPHNAANLAGIEAACALLPGIPQTATFDTAFHRHLPPAAFRYPLPAAWCAEHGVRRYGFDGCAHQYALYRGAAWLSKNPDACNLITLHAGRSLSLCAIRQGVSIDSSMGFTPLEGVPGETASGDIDPGILYFMTQQEQLTPAQFVRVLRQQSGLRGVSGCHGGHREVAATAAAGDARCRLALEVQGYRLRKYLGAFWAAVGHPQALVISVSREGMGWSQREAALDGLEFLGLDLDREKNRRAAGDQETLISTAGSSVAVLLIPAGGEQVIAEEAAALLDAQKATAHPLEPGPPISYPA